jgi:hypothetical protein
MENKPLERKLARLPNGEKVVIEELDLKNNFETAVVRRIDGERSGTRAICAISRLEYETVELHTTPPEA